MASTGSEERMGTTGVLLIAHGSRRPEANRELFELAERVAAAGRYSIVEASFLELVPPNIAAGAERCLERGASRVLLIPYLLSMGVHQTRDLAAARDALARRHPGAQFCLAPSLGPHPWLDRLVLERIDQVDSEPTTLTPGWVNAELSAPEEPRPQPVDSPIVPPSSPP
jgi:sirohydrochlorin ferrochelatase